MITSYLCLLLNIPKQLFLEEERERELEQLYEHGVAETLNRSDAAIGSGAPGTEGPQPDNAAEATAVSKQTTDTLMAGERIMEALDLADAEREAAAEFEATKARISPQEAEKLPPPTKNPVLAAYKLGPEEYVLMVLEKIPSSALTDALLVLPFGKVQSLIAYLDEFAQRVCGLCSDSIRYITNGKLGLEHRTDFPSLIFLVEDSS